MCRQAVIIYNNVRSLLFNNSKKYMCPLNNIRRHLYINNLCVLEKKLLNNVNKIFMSMNCNRAKSDDCHRHKEEKKPCNLPKIMGPTEPCPKVCLPCCRKVVIDKKCVESKVRENDCTGGQSKYPSFSEVVATLKQQLKSDCYKYFPYPETYVAKKTMIAINHIKMQRKILGFKSEETKRNYSTFTKFLQNKNYAGINIGDGIGVESGKLNQNRCFSTTTNLLRKQSDDKCGKGGELPCLKRDTLSLRKLVKSKKTCEKICMPCCGKTRDPPECFSPYKKDHCSKILPPKPAFSECQEVLKDYDECECVSDTKICPGTSANSAKCDK